MNRNEDKDDIYDDTRMWSRKSEVDATADAALMPRVGDNEVTVPLVADQEIVVRRPGSNEEIVIKKTKTGDEARNA